MFNRITAMAVAFALLTAPVAGATAGDSTLSATLQKVLDRYLVTRSKAEHISAISLSVSLKGATSNINVAAGTTRYPNAGEKVVPANLFEIGSNTKAFTSIAILQLEADGKLSIADTLGKWLPQYPAWKSVTIHRLLDMTSPIPGYDNQDSIARIMGRTPNHVFTKQELVASVYPHNGKPQPVHGWTYSNTNYILASMIIEKATGKSYSDAVRGLFDRVGLHNTFYETDHYPSSVTDRMVSGYFSNHDADNALLKPLLGRDVKNDSVSWMQAAGAIVSEMEDVTGWSRALYEGPLLADKQRKELMTIVSLKSGKPIATTSAADPLGFGLGVAQGTKPELGTFWYYEGMTLGYRVVYFYLPKSQTVVAVGLNSQPDSKQNKVDELMTQIYEALHAASKL